MFGGGAKILLRRKGGEEWSRVSTSFHASPDDDVLNTRWKVEDTAPRRKKEIDNATPVQQSPSNSKRAVVTFYSQQYNNTTTTIRIQ